MLSSEDTLCSCVHVVGEIGAIRTPGSVVDGQPNCAARLKRLVNLLTCSPGYLIEVCIHVFTQHLDHDDTENDCRGTVVVQHLHTHTQLPVVRLTSQSLTEKIACL